MAREGGASLRQHLEAAGKVVDEPEPLSHGYLLDWFWRLSNRRASTGFGLSPLGFEAIAAWARLSGEAPEPWEVAAIEHMDNAFLAESLKHKPKGERHG